jgi:uncharacterized membrane protein YkoI
MNRSLRYFAAVIAALALLPSVHAQMSARESNRIDKGKITKNEAQHLVENAYPGAKITKCELHGAKGHSMWLVELVKSGSNKTTTVEVDGRTGKIVNQK